jgi:hypothetical protein
MEANYVDAPILFFLCSSLMEKMIIAIDTRIMNLHVLPNLTYAMIVLIDFDQVGCHLRWHGRVQSQ